MTGPSRWAFLAMGFVLVFAATAIVSAEIMPLSAVLGPFLVTGLLSDGLFCGACGASVRATLPAARRHTRQASSAAT